MSDYITENEWINKKISEGYFGFDVCELDKLYSEEEVKELKKIIQYHFDGMDKEASSEILRLTGSGSLPLKNGRYSMESFLQWFKETLTKRVNADSSRNAPEPIRRYIHSLDLDGMCKKDNKLLDLDRPIQYSYEFVKLAYYYLHESIFTFEQTMRIPGISDLTITTEPTAFNFYKNNENKVSLEKTVNKISKDVIKKLYNEELDNYQRVENHINILPEFSFMACHEDASQDERDFTILIYFNTEWKNEHKGKLRYHIPRISVDSWGDDPNVPHSWSKFHQYDILPIFTNVVVMNHQKNDNIGALIVHEVRKNMNKKNRYALYSTYRKK